MVSKTLKRQDKTINMRIIRKKGVIKGRSQGQGEPEGIFVWLLSLGIISKQLGFVDVDAAFLEEGTNPILSSTQIWSFLTVECCSGHGIQLVLQDAKWI